MDNLDEFLRALDRIEQEIPLAHRDAQVSLAVVALDDVVTRSPVRTGAYRANHVVAEGEGGPRTPIFEASNRPGDRPVSVDAGQVLAPPNVVDAKAALANVAPFQTLWIWNNRPYASFLEEGTSRMPARHIYRSAGDRIEGLAGVVDKAFEERLNALSR